MTVNGTFTPETHLIYTIDQLIASKVENYKNNVALINPNNQRLTYGNLGKLINYVASRLSEIGITSEDRVATILPNGLEMAVMFLGITKSAICCPLNPNYRASELEFYLTDLQIKALVTLENQFSTAVEVAQQLNILVIDLVADFSKNCSFTLDVNKFYGNFPKPQDNTVNPDRIALILHTSGTTSRPKQVPLTHRNLCTAAKNIGKALQLQENDRCLNLMPFFHVHGLVITLLSSLSAGSSIICIPQFNLKQFWLWLEQFAPTWYSGVSTIHMEILQEARNNHQIKNHSSLRFIRTSSAPIPPEAILELENIFKIPVIQGYGMTEGSPQLTVNPLPPHQRKPESVGLPCGVRVGIMDDQGNFLPPMKIGEVVINDIYFDGYLGDPKINEQAFCKGWFRTGDLGYLDEEGYLFLKGRIKEIINRGGEKIMPLEVDMVAMKLPEIYQAVTFPISHPTLGEDIALAVVLEPNQIITPQAIKQYLSENLVSFKVPHQIIIVEELPKGATKKLQRTALANQLVSSLNNIEKIAPRNEIEKQLVLIWEKILNVSPVGITDDFFALGGNSISAASLLIEISKLFKFEDPSKLLLNLSTIEKLSQELNQLHRAKEVNSDQPKILQKVDSYKSDFLSKRVGLTKIKTGLKSILTPSNWLNSFDYETRKKLHQLVVEYQWNHQKFYHPRHEIVQCVEELDLTEQKIEIIKGSLFSILLNNRKWIKKEFSKEWVFEKWVAFEGLEIFEQLQDSHSGLIFVTGHFINLSTAKLIQRKLQSSNYIHINAGDAHKFAKKLLSINKVNHEQALSGLVGLLYAALNILEQGGIVYIAGDGYHGGSAINLPFHGRQRPFHTGFAELSLMSGKPALPVFTSLERDGLIKVKICQEIIAKGDTHEQKVLSMVQQYAELLQQRWLDDLASVSHRHLGSFLNLPAIP